MKNLTETQLKNIAKEAGIEIKLADRLLGSLPIPISHSPSSSGAQDSTQSKTLDLGLRIINPEILTLFASKGEDDMLITRIAQALREYVKISPQVVAWIGRGDFDPKKIPSQLKRAVLQHACRTAGRLRANLIKSCNT